MKTTILVPACDDESQLGRVLAGLALLSPSPTHEVKLGIGASIALLALPFRPRAVAGPRVPVVASQHP